jgi:hypothetical protein
MGMQSSERNGLSDGGSVLSMTRGDTGEGIMLFEETAPAGTETTSHLLRDKDEAA